MGLFDMFKTAEPIPGTAPTPTPTPTPTPAPGTPAVPAPKAGDPKNPKPGDPKAAVPGTVIPPGTGVPTPNIEPVVGPGTAPNGVIPDSVKLNADGSPIEPASPIDQYAELWHTEPVKPGDEPKLPPTLDAAKLQEKVASIDFSSVLTPEMVTAVTAGGEGATEAFVKALNSVAQNVMVQSTLVNNKLIEQAVERTKAETLASIPNLIKSQNLANNLSENNPLFDNPAIKPMIELATKQFEIKFPTATAPELTKMAQNYVLEMAKFLTPEQQKSGNPLGEVEEFDFRVFLDAKQTPVSQQ